MPAEGAPSSADMDTTRGQHPCCNGPMATTQPWCAPRPLPHGGGHRSPASSSTMAAAGQFTRRAPKLAIMKRRRRHRRKKRGRCNCRLPQYSWRVETRYLGVAVPAARNREYVTIRSHGDSPPRTRGATGAPELAMGGMQ
ncbi:hypothetical protein HPB50_013393 [Hyalomma asiaticum]|uniref:Uncharacterized protein n=1 Tax=Hyalomma asiaticum TaxID=266040 RepID=A0ACB7RLX6_HYAAI|nr:hypothetical protein HPB50_013393 [Hyalomma asiaticum]